MSLTLTVNTWYQRWISQRNWVGQVLRKIRRFYLGTFFPEYVEKAILETRQGECHRCGLCCELVYKCPFLGRDSQNLPYCRVYGDLRPANCRNYPFDSVDSEIEQCGFTFKSTHQQASPSIVGVAGVVVASKKEEIYIEGMTISNEKLALSSSAVFQGKL